MKAYVRKQVNAHVNPVLEATPGDSSVECSHDHDHDADKVCDADMMNYIASLMKGKGKGHFGKRHGPMDVDEGQEHEVLPLR